MTKPAKQGRIAPLDLGAAILAKLQEHPCTAAELAQLTGYNVTTIRTRLEVLEERRRAHRIGHRNQNNCGMCFTWHAGKAPDVVEGPVPDHDPIEVPRRFFATSFPPIGRRDPLVAALFGVPGARP